MEDKYYIEIKNIKPTDTIILHFKEDNIDIDDAIIIFNKYKECFPNNTVIGNYDGYCIPEVVKG